MWNDTFDNDPLDLLNSAFCKSKKSGNVNLYSPQTKLSFNSSHDEEQNINNLVDFVRFQNNYK